MYYDSISDISGDNSISVNENVSTIFKFEYLADPTIRYILKFIVKV